MKLNPVYKTKIITEILKKVNKNKVTEPMSKEEISQIQLAKNRTSTQFITLPLSVQILLSIDKNFTISDKPLLKYFFERKDSNGKVHSAKVSDELFFMFEGHDLKGQKLLWNDTEEMPGLIELYSTGDQRVYLYLGEKSEEFPIARFDNEPCVWLTETSLIHHILSSADISTENLFKDKQEIVEFLGLDKEKELEKLKKLNKHFLDKEWWYEKFEWPE